MIEFLVGSLGLLSHTDEKLSARNSWSESVAHISDKQAGYCVALSALHGIAAEMRLNLLVQEYPRDVLINQQFITTIKAASTTITRYEAVDNANAKRKSNSRRT